VWSNDPETYAGNSDTTGMASRARQVKGDDPDKKGYPGPPGWGFDMRLTISPRKHLDLLRNFYSRKPNGNNKDETV